MNIGYCLTQNAFKYPEKTAIYYENRRINYAELNLRVNKLANALFGLGIKKGENISILMRNCPEYIETIFAGAKAGVATSAVGHLLLDREIEYLLNDSESRALVLEEEFIKKIEKIRSKLNGIKHFILVGNNNKYKTYLDYETLLKNSQETIAECEVTFNDKFMLDYTSGTTGFPKGAIISHRSRLLVFLFQAIEYGTRCDDINLTTGNLCHGAPRHHALLQIYLGGSVVIRRKFDPIDVMDMIETYKVTNFYMAPAMFNEICKIPAEKFHKYRTDSVRTLSSGGAPLPTNVKGRLLELFPNSGLNEFYGVTEAGLISNLRPADQERKTNCVGQLYNGVKIKLMDENEREVPKGEAGEIYIKSPMLFNGYYNKPEQTREVMKNGFFATGDIGKYDSENYLYIIGRKKDMFISGGVNIYPAEIEDVLNSHPKITETAVIGIPDEKWGEVGKAFIVKKVGEKLSEDELIEYCKDKIAKMKIPRYFSFMDSLPKNEAGKIVKKGLAKL